MGYANPERQRAYQRRWLQKRREAWIEDNGPCAKCGSWDDPQVDHVDPGTKVSHNVWSWSKARREAELAKCQVLCSSCHFKKTGKENSRPIPHGTDGAYTKRKCRCAACREAHRVVKKAWRAQQRAKGLPAP